MDTQLISVIFGMKLRQARTEAGLTLSEFASQSELSPSYMTEVEKGRKYPRADKIMRMATVLGKEYDELVSISLDPSLADLQTTLGSSFMRKFPFEEFGLEMSNLVDLLTRAPDKASALLHAIIEVGRQFDLRDEHFLLAALRSYQEYHENYFPEVESAAAAFAQEHDLIGETPLRLESVEEIIQTKYGYELDNDMLAQEPTLSNYRSVFVKGKQPKLLLNMQLSTTQRRFSIAREMGYRVLGLTERANTSSPDRVDSFAQVLNDYKASYFAGALLMPRALIVQDIEEFFARTTWAPEPLFAMMEKYDVTPEMLLYRFSQLIPEFFGAKMHFLRLEDVLPEEVDDTVERYKLVKQFNMNRLLTPSGIALDEHFCRRWLVTRLLKELRSEDPTDESTASGMVHMPMADHDMVIGAQMSEFLDSRDRFLCFGFARPLQTEGSINSTVIVGFRVDSDLPNTIKFMNDPAIPFITINETCERCPLVGDQCTLRAFEPVVLEKHKAVAERKEALGKLVAKLREA